MLAIDFDKVFMIAHGTRFLPSKFEILFTFQLWISVKYLTPAGSVLQGGRWEMGDATISYLPPPTSHIPT